VSNDGATPLVVIDRRPGEQWRVLGVIRLKDTVKPGMRERFDELRAMGIRTVMITGDNPLTAAAIAAEAGVDDFLAEATPEDKMALIKREQAGGNLVAMTGDGTNDAPALAQADVGVAMNTGTQAAKEAGNMVDLDSNPTKLIEIVEVGKQLLMTRGRSRPSRSPTTSPSTSRSSRRCSPACCRRSTAERDGPRLAPLGDPVGGHLQRARHHRARAAGPEGREVPGRGGVACCAATCSSTASAA
jgi:soluble P-type ATPase